MLKKGFAKYLATGACAVVLAFSLSGCAAQQSTEDNTQKENRQYMAQINQSMEDIQGDLSGFSDAVAAGDVVSMRVQADAASKHIESLQSITAPEGLADIQKYYVEGCETLESALGDYVALYEEVASSADGQTASVGDYDERLTAIQKSYNSGIAKLEQADKTAADMK